MNKMKKLLACLLALVMIISLVPMPAMAIVADDCTHENAEYRGSYWPADKAHDRYCLDCEKAIKESHYDDNGDCLCDFCEKAYHPNLQFVAKTEATCTTDGYKKNHWICPDCGYRFKDSIGEYRYSNDSDIIIEASHIPEAEMSKDDTHHWYECERAGCDEQLEKAEHNMEYTGQYSPADKTHQMKCSECGKFRNDSHIDEDKNCECDVCKDGYHANLVWIEAKEATCYEDGYTVSHWYCPDCGERYKDEATDAPIYDDVVIKAGHVKAAEMSKNDTHHWYECDRAGCDEQLEKAEHEMVYNNQWSPANQTHQMKCTGCGMYRDDPHVDEDENCECDVCKDGYHANFVFIEKKDATCEEDGYTRDHWYCPDCGKRYKDSAADAPIYDDVVIKAGHIPAEELSTDETHHWYECEREGCDEQLNKAKHEDEDNNHKCDACEETISLCVDNTDDHKCDICEGVISLCISNDDNHECDICDEVISLCTDNTKDHKCDVCGEVISLCADTDDHKCDICDEVISLCADNDGDHKCDICDEVISLCADNTKDHKCDVCKGVISLCADTDDHKCDICDEVISLCADEDDHKCDICGETISLCADEDDDHACDLCGKVISLCADTDGDHACDLCDEVISLCADEDDHKCDICGDTISECADSEDDDDYDCDVCGKTLAVPSTPVKPAKPTVPVKPIWMNIIRGYMNWLFRVR